MEPKNRFAPMKQGVLQDESMEIHVASMSNGGEHKKHEKTAAKVKKTVEQRDKTEIETRDKYGPRTLPKTKRMDAPKAWMALDTN